MSAKGRIAARVVDLLLAVAFIVLLATPVTWAVWHEWVGIFAFVLTVVHIVMSKKAIGRLARRRRVGAFATLVFDALLIVCIFGLVASSIVLSEHVLAWAPAVPGASWARTAHLLCSYWGFVLVFIHAGVHLRVAVGKLTKSRALVWAARIAFVVFGAVGVWSLFDTGMWSYMTLANQFVFVDPSVPFALKLAQYAAIAVLVTGLAHYVSAICRKVVRRSEARSHRSVAEHKQRPPAHRAGELTERKGA